MKFIRAVSFWLVLALILPNLLPICQGAQAAGRMSHPCCQGGQACHAQVRRVPCCERQSARVVPPAIPLSKAGSEVAVLPAKNLVAQSLLMPPPLLWQAASDGPQAQAPPLYLAKQSLLC